MGNQGEDNKKKAGYEYLLAYKISVPIYDYTVEFCKRWIPSNSRTKDQMEQAARSGMQNILEGNQQEGMKGYIKLCGIARGSLEELLNDYLSYARQHGIVVWDRGRVGRELPEVEQVWSVLRATPVLPSSPDFPHLPDHPERAVNLLITLVHQSNYLLDKLVVSLKDKHMHEGGLTEELYRKRVEYRKMMNKNEDS